MKKIISLLLSFVMVFGISAGLNLSVYADENGADITDEITVPEEPNKPDGSTEPADPAEPSEPTKLNVPTAELIVNENGTFTIIWNEIAGADKYEIYVLNNITGNYQLNGTVAKTSATTAVAPYGVKYSYKVRAINSEDGAITSDFSEVVEGINNKKLQTPNLKVTENKNGSFTLSWNKISGADKYELCIRNADGTYKLMKTTNGTSFTTAIAPYGKDYAYKMRAVTSNNVDAVSSYSEVVGAVNKVFLKAPSLKTTVNNNGTFTLSWNKIAGAEKYELYIRQSNGSYKLMKTTGATSFTTAVAVYGKQYSYKIKALNSEISSSFSAAVNQVNKKRLQSPAIKVTVNANGSFKLSWNKIAGADKYELYIKQANGSYKLMKTTKSTSFTTAAAAYGKQYSYRAKALSGKNSKITSELGAAVHSVNNKRLQTPSGVKIAVNKNGSFTLSWNKVAGADKYELYIKQPNGSYKLMKTTGATSFTTAVAKRGKAYSYKVRAVKNSNKSAVSAYSSVVNAKRK